MRWHEVVTHDDAHASLRRSLHHRELAEVRKRRRLRVRRALLPLALCGAALLVWAVTSMDNATLQMLKIAAGMVLLLPWMATYDVLGEARR